MESRAITTSAVPGALVPLLDHLRNDSTGSPAVLVGDEGLESGAMVAVAPLGFKAVFEAFGLRLEDLEPEMELRNCFDSVSNQDGVWTSRNLTGRSSSASTERCRSGWMRMRSCPRSTPTTRPQISPVFQLFDDFWDYI